MEGVEEEARDKATEKATRDKGNKKSGASIKLIIILNLLSYCTYYLTILIIIKYYVCNPKPNIFYLSLFIET